MAGRYFRYSAQVTASLGAPRFQQIYLEITNICGRACAFCPGTARSAQRMDEALFRSAIAQIQPLAAQVLFHVLGEPLEHPDLPRWTALCQAQGLPVVLTTNGTRLTQPSAAALWNPIVRQVNFSMHGLNLDNPDDAASCQHILDFTRQALERRPELYINYRFWRSADQDRSELSPLERRLAEAWSTPWPRWDPQRSRQSRQWVGRLYLHRDSPFDWPGSAPARPRGTCRALQTHCAILSDGRVVPCCLDRDGDLTLGNLHQQSLETILASPRAVAMAQGFARGELVEALCQRCAYCRRFTR